MSDIETPKAFAIIEYQNCEWFWKLAYSGGCRTHMGRLRAGDTLFEDGRLVTNFTCEKWRYPGEKEWRR